ncbi:hypothetical protein V5799_028827 [Amblyomma americanum]|uniref:Uncharacterized protein n=1 Tax=Amblyomma americanum TaxID=6943 RepID=A0AAQ4DBP0_AMBAM
MIRSLGSHAASKNTVRSCLILSPQINKTALSSMLLLHALTCEKTGSTHRVIDNTSIRGSPPDGPALHEVETGYDPVAWQ